MQKVIILRKVVEIFLKYLGSETNKDLRKQIQPGLFTNRKTPLNSNKIQMKVLISPSIQKAFNNVTNAEKLRIDTLDSDPALKEMLNLWEKMPKYQFSRKKKVLMKMKTVYFRNFIKGTVDVDNVLNLGIINAEILQQVVKSQIKSNKL